MMKPGAVVGTVLGALSLIMSFDAVEAAAAGKKVAYFDWGRRLFVRRDVPRRRHGLPWRWWEALISVSGVHRGQIPVQA